MDKVIIYKVIFSATPEQYAKVIEALKKIEVDVVSDGPIGKQQERK